MRPLAIGVVLGLAAAPLAAQAELNPFQELAWPLHSGFHRGHESGAEERPVFEELVAVPGATWLRLAFADAYLGSASRIELASLADGAVQVLDATSFRAWNQASAVLNGDALWLRLFAAPGDAGVFVELALVQAGVPGSAGLEESLCGRDDKVAASDLRVCRLSPIPCSAWRVTNGAFLTAGHCGQWLTSLVEFRVPPALPDGTPVAAHPDDQYPIDLASVTFVDGGVGHDWAVFGVGPNSNTGLLPHAAYGLPFRMTREAPLPGATIRITGVGLDAEPPGTTGVFNAENLTLQTAIGPLLGELEIGGTHIELEYQADTTTGNSGSPIIWDALDITIGVHSHLGCSDIEGNHGTSFELDALEAALAAFQGTDVRHVDAGHPLPLSQDGTLFRPFATLPAAVLAVPDGGLVSLVAGSYPASAGNAITIDRPMTLVAPCGTVVIGE